VNAPVAIDLSLKCPRCHYDMGGEASDKSRRFLHAIIGAAWLNWPETHKHRFATQDHLRAWLFVHAEVDFYGGIVADPEQPRQIDEIIRLANDLRTIGVRGWFATTSANEVELRVPRTSRSATKGGPKKVEYYQLIDKVLAVIEAEAGIEVKDLRREAELAVARKAGLGKRRG
jgi:hypothetical protein